MAAILRVSILGSLPGGEKWSVNPCWSLLGGSIDASPEELATVSAAISAITIPTTLRSIFSAETRIVGNRVEARTIAGVLEAQAESVISSPVGGSGAQNHPFQTSMVTSLKTATPGGRGRGRVYWPATGVGLESTTLRVASAGVASILTGVETYLSGIDAAINTTFIDSALVVWSRSSSVLHPVTSLRMGDVLDVQRRRRDTLTEGYTSSDWSP